MTAPTRPRAERAIPVAHPVPTLYGVYVVPSSQPGRYYPVTGVPPFLVCPCEAGDRDGPCIHVDAVNAQLAKEITAMTTEEKSQSMVLAETRPAVVRATEQQLKVVAAVGAMGAAMELAKFFGDTGMLPPEVKTQSAAALILMKAISLDIPPAEAFEYIDVIKGRIFLRAQMVRALVARSGKGRIQVVESTAQKAVCVGVRTGWQSTRVEYTIEDAQRAGLLNNDTYKKHPADMLVARASVRVGRRMFADILSGMDVGGPDDAVFDTVAEPLPPARAETVIDGEFRESPDPETGELPPEPPTWADTPPDAPAPVAQTPTAPESPPAAAQPLFPDDAPIDPWDALIAGARARGIADLDVAEVLKLGPSWSRAELREFATTYMEANGGGPDRLLSAAADVKAARG